MIVCMNVSHFVKICQVLMILHQLICRGVANFGKRYLGTSGAEYDAVFLLGDSDEISRLSRLVFEI